MPGPAFLQGESVALHTVEVEDVEFLQETINDPRVREGIMAVEPKNRETEREWIESMGEDDAVHLVVVAEEEPVGIVSLKPPDEVWGRVEIGYMIAPSDWDSGYATEAVALLAGYAFEERRLNKVYATVYETNPASARVLEKVGFEREGVLRKEGFVDGEYVDLYRYGLLADDWRAE